MSVPASYVSAGASLRAGERLRILLVPDSIHWITGTIARSIVAHNPWIEGTIISGAVLDTIAAEQPDLFEAFDLVHFVCPYASKRWLPILRERLPCVTSHHHVSDDWELQRHNLDGDAIIVGSLQWAEDAEARGAPAEKVVYVPYGVDASRFIPATSESRRAVRQSLGIASDAITVGFFAKLSSNERDRKGTDIFAAAAQALNRQLPQLVILIIGPGWDDMVANLSAAGVKCVWLPFVKDSARMPEMYQALNFYWVTARVEGGPVTLLEAMSTGLCCITTPVGLAKEIVETGVNGIVVPFDDVQSFAERTLAYAKRPEARAEMGSHARRTILETMDVPITSQGVRKAYDVAIAQFSARTSSNLIVRSTGERPSPLVMKRVAVLEELVWAEALILHKQRAMAWRLIATTWMNHPFSATPLRFLLRNVLPRRLVQAIMRAKATSGTRTYRANGS